MKIAIIGAGFTGLSAAHHLLEKGHSVTVFEKDTQPGGLAIGYREKGWEWSLEKHYHHWFTNDASVLTLAKEINYPVLIRRPKTSAFVNKKIYQLDSPSSVLTFPELSLIERLRMALVLGIIRYNPYWKPLEKIRAASFLSAAMGEKAYKLLWEPLFVNKFGTYVDTVSLAWFWARITKRTPSLAYPTGGFLNFAQALIKTIEEKGGTIYLETETLSLKDTNNREVTVKGKNGTHKTHTFDKVIVTLPSLLFLKIAAQLPDSYKNKLGKLKIIGATNLILRLKKPFFNDNTYWLSVCDTASPVMVIVEHTNFIDKKYYNNEHLVYLGNYLPADHPNFSKTKEELLTLYDPFLININPNYRSTLIDSQLFKAPFAQPIIPMNYSKIIPSMETPLPNVYLANIEQVYPWDRGTNYAVELGKKVAKLIRNEN